MSVRIVLANTPAPDQLPPVHPIPCDGVAYPDVHYDGRKVGDLFIDPHTQTVSLGADHKFRTGKGMSVTHHLHPNKLNVDYRGKRVTIFIPDDTLFDVILGQLTLFSYSPPGHCLLAPIAVGAVSTTFSAFSATSQSVVAVRHVRAQDLRHAAADDVVDRSHAILKTIPESERHHILRPSVAFWHKNNFYAIAPLYTPLQQKLPLVSATPSDGESVPATIPPREIKAEQSNPNASLDYHQIRNITRDLLKALAHLHSHGVVHGHVTRQHVLLTADNRVRLTGFGHSITAKTSVKGAQKTATNGESDSAASNPPVSIFSNPPVDTSVELRHGPYAKMLGRDAVPPGGLKKRNRPTPAADVWAAGVILYAMLHNDDMSGLHNRDVRSKTLQMARSNTDWTTFVDIDDNVPADLASLVRALLQPIAKKRLSARAALEHPAVSHNQLGDDACDENEREQGQADEGKLGVAKTNGSLMNTCSVQENDYVDTIERVLASCESQPSLREHCKLIR